MAKPSPALQGLLAMKKSQPPAAIAPALTLAPAPAPAPHGGNTTRLPMQSARPVVSVKRISCDTRVLASDLEKLQRLRALLFTQQRRPVDARIFLIGLHQLHAATFGPDPVPANGAAHRARSADILTQYDALGELNNRHADDSAKLLALDVRLRQDDLDKLNRLLGIVFGPDRRPVVPRMFLVALRALDEKHPERILADFDRLEKLTNPKRPVLGQPAA